MSMLLLLLQLLHEASEKLFAIDLKFTFTRSPGRFHGHFHGPHWVLQRGQNSGPEHSWGDGSPVGMVGVLEGGRPGLSSQDHRPPTPSPEGLP